MIECPHCRRPTTDKAMFPTIRGVRCEHCALVEFLRYLIDHLRKSAFGALLA